MAKLAVDTRSRCHSMSTERFGVHFTHHAGQLLSLASAITIIVILEERVDLCRLKQQEHHDCWSQLLRRECLQCCVRRRIFFWKALGADIRNISGCWAMLDSALTILNLFTQPEIPRRYMLLASWSLAFQRGVWCMQCCPREALDQLGI